MGVCLRMDRLVLIEFDLRLVWFMLFRTLRDCNDCLIRCLIWSQDEFVASVFVK